MGPAVRTRPGQLHAAVLARDTHEARRLLSLGANPDAVDRHGLAPLHYAAVQQQAEMVGVLARGGATIDARDARGYTALWRAVFNYQGSPATIQALLRHGAQPDTASIWGMSARELAETVGPEVTRLFAEC